MKAQIDIQQAIVVLEKNLNEHIQEYSDAIEVWTKDAIEALEKVRGSIDREGLKVNTEKLFQVFHAKPVDNRANYSKHLGMLRRAQESLQTHIECDEDDYDRIFQDNWDWRTSSKARNTSYSSRKL